MQTFQFLIQEVPEIVKYQYQNALKEGYTGYPESGLYGNGPAKFYRISQFTIGPDIREQDNPVPGQAYVDVPDPALLYVQVLTHFSWQVTL